MKLPMEDWTLLDNLMSRDDAIDPRTGYSMTGFHYELSQMLANFGYRNIGRNAAWDLAMELWEAGPQ